MKAIRSVDGTLRWTDAEHPKPGPGEVRIRVMATAVNRADLAQRAGRYPPPPGASDILGLEAAGVVDAIGPGVQERAVGDEVMALLSGGGYAEQVVCPASHTLYRPDGWSWAQAAAVMEVFATAWVNLRVEGSLSASERVLVHAGASGVGTAAIQLCRRWENPVFVTVGTDEKVNTCLRYGAESGALRGTNWAARVRAWGRPDVILCPNGGAYLADNIGVLNKRGRLVVIGLLGGSGGDLPVGKLLVKRLTVAGSVLRSRSNDEKNAVIEGLIRDVEPGWRDGSLVPVIHKVLPIQEAQNAHEIIESNLTSGKVVLTITG